MYNWRAAGVLLTILFSLVSAFPLGGQPPGAEFFGAGRRVPSIMGRSANEATAILRQYGLRGRDSGRAPSTEYRPGTVIDQDPRPGSTIPKNRLVAYWLADQEPSGVVVNAGQDPSDIVADVVKVFGALAAILVVAFIATKLARRPPPKIKLVPFKDYGEQHVASSPGPLVFALELCPVLDLGNQELDKVGPLVAQGEG
jgi:hypothetical protein